MALASTLGSAGRPLIGHIEHVQASDWLITDDPAQVFAESEYNYLQLHIANIKLFINLPPGVSILLVSDQFSVPAISKWAPLDRAEWLVAGAISDPILSRPYLEWEVTIQSAANTITISKAISWFDKSKIQPLWTSRNNDGRIIRE